MSYDLLLKGGMIYNGAGTPGVRGDVAVQAGKIVAVGQVIGLHDRGTITVGKAADLVVFNPATIRPQATQTVNDLPGGNARLCQGAEGIHCTVVNGTVVTQDGVHTGTYPGRVLRG